MIIKKITSRFENVWGEDFMKISWNSSGKFNKMKEIEGNITEIEIEFKKKNPKEKNFIKEIILCIKFNDVIRNTKIINYYMK